MTDSTENQTPEGDSQREPAARPPVTDQGDQQAAATPTPVEPTPSEPQLPPTPAPAAVAPAAPVDQAAPEPPRYGQYAPPTTAASAPSVGAFGQPAHAAGPAETQPTASFGALPNDAGAHGAAPARNRMAIPVIAALAVGALIGGVAGAGVTLLADGGFGRQVAQVGDSTPSTITVNDNANATTVTAVAAKSGPSVVTISVAGRTGSGTGSGVVIDDEGHIVTNNHVVTLDGAAGQSTITVQTWDGRILDATIVGTDPLTDLAVIKVDADDLPAIEMADSDDLNVGDVAIAIGAPLGLANTVTDGIVSALNRSITVASSEVPDDSEDTEETPQPDDSPFDFWRFDDGQGGNQDATSTVQLSVLQTDASINPGNSGGALLNADGDLIGVNVAIATAGSSQSTAGSIGVGFAIPANLVKRIANEIIDSGTATHGLLGAMVRNSQSGRLGAEIDRVTEGGAASAAGIRAGDVVTYLGDVPISSSSDLTAQVRSHPAGEETTVTLVRGDDTITLPVTLGALE